MFLKSITLDGFKSFADRSELSFSDGITAIVGPNGCGKSNILDAVRWVLGEQSAKSLRGDRMLDVVFSGSRSRKPANFAEVELTFDNRAGYLACDDETVTVGRTLYRNGESEYRLNGKPCRLKDVRDLLLDTGVGVDAYSIIEQGRVDRLLQSSPIERREIFEEAAGISRYKVRRAESQRKLERTEQNLLRLNDVIEELERRLRSVKLAATKARRFQEYDQRLRELRSSYALAEYHGLRQNEAEARGQASAARERLQGLRAELARADAEASERDHALQRLDEQIRDAEERLSSLQMQSSAVAERITQGRHRVEELTAIRERRAAQAAEIVSRVESSLEQLAAGESSLASLAAEVQEGAGRVESMRERCRAAEARCDEARRALDQERTAVFEAARETSLLQNQQSFLAQQHERLTGQLDRMLSRRREIEEERNDVLARRAAEEQRGVELERQAGALSSEIRRLDEELESSASLVGAVRERIGESKDARTAISSRLNVLEELERRREGVGQGAQAVLAWRDDAQEPTGVLGLVADLLCIRDARVALLQPVLSTFERAVVVRDTYSFLSELARRGALRASVDVIALDRLPAESPRQTYENAPGYVGRAADWVECADEHRPLAEHLLGRVVIVDALERALALAGSADAGFVFVTLAGEVVGRDGRFTLGRASQAAGLISRRAEILQLRDDLAEVEARLVAARREETQLAQAISDLELGRADLLDRIAALQREHVTARNELMRAADHLGRLDRETAGLESEANSVRRALAENDAEIERLRVEHAGACRRHEAHESQIAALAEHVNELEAEVARHAQALTEALVEIGRTSEKRAAGERAVGELRRRVDALRGERSAAESEAADADRRISALQADLETASQQQAALADADRTQQAGVFELRSARQELRRQIEECGAAARELHRQIEAVEEELHSREMLLREIAVRNESLITRIREDLSLDMEALYASYRHAEQDWDAIRAEIAELREKSQRLGNVNLDAITELDELAPRYDNLASQRQDLVNSIERLRALIAELDAESHRRFEAAFDEICANFADLFRKLFGGGKADILLEDPSRPLECGIEIIARPPGKEPQSISLLSGGEKTMTCVALLMAVFKSKPSPFAILDEVDAALDEANIDRFNRLLHEFLSVSQFIVITHNKRTMASADVLYGITMEEPGVSKRVSVRFDDRVHTPSVA